MRDLKEKKPSVCLTLAIFFLLISTAHADPPKKTAVDEVRDQLMQWNRAWASGTLEQCRRGFHAENEREEIYADYIAHENWAVSKAQAAVRANWGPEAEAKFCRVRGADTLEDDQAADIAVDGDHATVTWQVRDLYPTAMIKVDGHWLIDIHPLHEQLLKDKPDAEEYEVETGVLMQQAMTEIADGKFDSADEFIADFKTKYELLLQQDWKKKTWWERLTGSSVRGF